jgi:Flp pilus assembly protein TadD
VPIEPAPQSDPETTPEQYRQRALLMADLGRYDEAVTEVAAGLAAAPGDAGLLSTLARVHVIAEQPADALVAAELAAAAAPGTMEPLVIRAMALADERRFPEAAQVAADILATWPDDAYAQRTGAALLSESRNGQEALNAAWNGVRLTPADAEAHLVLAVVAARLRLFDLAQRAYGEALELDTAIGAAQRDVGVVRLERRRWALALEEAADEAIAAADPVEPPQQAVQVSLPGPVLDRFGETVVACRQAVLYSSNSVLIAAVLTAVMTLVSAGVARMWGGVIGVAVLVAVGVWLVRALPEPLGPAVRRVSRSSRGLTFAICAAALAPVGLLVFAVTGGVVPLVAAMVVAGMAELVVLTAR